jgi:hypothetical protein
MEHGRHPEIPYLKNLRFELVRVAARQNRRRRVRIVAVRLSLAGVSLAAAAVAGLTLFGAGGPAAQSADAAILRQVRRAVTPPAGVVLHEKALTTIGSMTVDYEFWQRSDEPHAYRVDKAGFEGAYTGSATQTFDPATNTIVERPADQAEPYIDPVAEVRQLLAEGSAHIVGTTEIDGERLLEITASSSSDTLLDGTLYVDATTYHPVRAELGPSACHDCGGPEQIRFLVYEYLPATPANVGLTSLTAQHPDARVVEAPAPPTSSDATTPPPAPKQGPSKQ